MILPEHIDDDIVLAELHPLFEAYEQALMRNDIAALNAFFWDDARVTRYGIADRQWGHHALAQHRANTPAPDFTRQLQYLRLHSYGPDVAVAQVEFVRSDTSLRGFQTQTWVRMSEGWKIVAAHVSMIPFPGELSE